MSTHVHLRRVPSRRARPPPKHSILHLTSQRREEKKKIESERQCLPNVGTNEMRGRGERQGQAS